MQPIYVFRHIECEGPGYLQDILQRHGLETRLIAIDAGERVPASFDGAAALVFLGGPMSVNDSDRWIADELALIRDAVGASLPVLGHCLGGQLIARALGGSVGPNPVREIGWHKVESLPAQRQHPLLRGLPATFDAFHWHGETFSLPAGAVPLLRSRFCENQAFVLGSALAVQCHFEVMPEMIGEWSRLYADQIAETSENVQSQTQMLDSVQTKWCNMRDAADILYANWLGAAGLSRAA